MIVKCTKCHHEWQEVEFDARIGHKVCDWCGAPGEKIADDYMDEEVDDVFSLAKFKQWLEGRDG